MLANNNYGVINKLAKNSLRTNRKQFKILFFTIALSAFMLLCVFTAGITYLDLSRLQDNRLAGAQFDVVIMNGFAKEQREVLLGNSEIQSVGVESYAGYISGTEFDDTVEIGLLWCDQTFWEEQKAPVRTKMEGAYPQKKHELMVTKEALRACGNEHLGIGDTFSLTYETNHGVFTEAFTISGIWDGYGDRSPIFVSEEFYKESGYRLEYDGILYAELGNRFVLPSTIQNIEESLQLSQRQAFQTTDYIQNSLKILCGICGLCVVICLSAYLLIYNILYLSVTERVRYYGLLQTLGMTKRQLVQFIRRQMSFIGMCAIAVGIVLGGCCSVVLVPYLMKVLGITSGNLELHVYPGVMLLCVLVAGAAILCGIRKPIQIAANVTPVEAAKYRADRKIGSGYKKSRKGGFFWRMSMQQLKKDKKKTVVVFLSLASSLVVFYCLTSIISTQGERTVMPAYWDADFIIRNSTQTEENVCSARPALDGAFYASVNDMPGIKETHIVKGVPITLCDDAFGEAWVGGYADTKPYLSHEDVLAEFRGHPEKYYGMLKGIDEREFEYLNQLLGASIDEKSFLDGKICIVSYPGFEVPPKALQGEKLTYCYAGQAYDISIAAVSYEGYHGGTTNIGPNLIVSQKFLETLTDQSYILNINIKYDKMYDESTERAIQKLLGDSPYRKDLLYESKLENMEAIQASQGDLMKVGAAVSALLLMVGVLNYINTMTGGIQSRRLTFSMMESLGMSEKQIRRLLVREGLLYAFFSIAITLTVGTGITYICFQLMNYMDAAFSIPVLPVISACILVVMICVAAPLISYQKLLAGRSIVERLRDYE